jgi:O-antigen ligase
MARNPFLMGTIAMFLLLLLNKHVGGYNTSTIAYFKKRVPMFFILAMVGVGLAGSIYEKLAANGTLGVEAQEKYYKQKMNGSNALEGGRSETFMGILLIKENPIWGYGSYARDKGDVFHMRYASEHNTDYNWTGDNDRFLPGHSYIVGAWMSNGILGGLFWLYVLWVMWLAFKSGCFLCEPRLLCLLMFQLCAFMWNVFFSPFGDRVFTMFLIIGVFTIFDYERKGLYKKNIIKKLNI